MQLFDQKKRSNREELPPSIYAALVDSLFQNFMPTLAGTFCTTIVAVMTALKTGNHMVWPCAIWISIVGVARAMQMRSYEVERRVSPSLRNALHGGKTATRIWRTFTPVRSACGASW